MSCTETRGTPQTSDIAIPRQIALLKIIAKGVKYCGRDHIEKKYRVDLGPPVRRRGEVFDSQALFDKKIGNRYLPGSMPLRQTTPAAGPSG